GFLAKHVDLKTEDGRQRVVRHGHLPEREVMSGGGMNRRRVMAGMAAASLLLGGCDFGPPARTYRYKLAIEMNTPEGPKRAFNVVEVKWEERIHQGLGGKQSITTVRGEALYLDLGPGRRPLVALLTSRVRPTDQPGQRRARCWGPSAPYCW
ncbi:MAG: hypothetical protein ABL908_04435, partial [Hyphomicrobium sp.]